MLCAWRFWNCSSAVPTACEGQGGDSGGVPQFLVKLDFVPWLMRMSQRKQVPLVIFCKIMALLSACSQALSGKPILLKFLGQLVEMLRSGTKGTQIADESRCRRLTAALNFVATLRLGPRGVALLVSNEPSAHTPASTCAQELSKLANDVQTGVGMLCLTTCMLDAHHMVGLRIQVMNLCSKLLYAKLCFSTSKLRVRSCAPFSLKSSPQAQKGWPKAKHAFGIHSHNNLGLRHKRQTVTSLMTSTWVLWEWMLDLGLPNSQFILH